MSISWRAPGRVNLIGEHTDYNDGFVLPFALEQACVATVEQIDGPEVEIRSAQLDEQRSMRLDEVSTPVSGWAGYAVGPAWVLRHRGHDVPGLRIAVDSTVLVGSGLSSSAALVCSVTRALDDLLDLQLPADELLAITRDVENDVVGAPTGGMDQLASLFCEADNALFCDMRSLQREQVPLPLAAAGLSVLVVDTRAEHRNADGAYGRLRRTCERAAELLGVPALRDVSPDDLDDALARLPEDDLRRAVRHVVTEDERTQATAARLRAGDVAGIGPLLTASHVSLRDDYRITIPELDTAVDTLLDADALGARMTGGGFGGCVIALLAPDAVPDAVSAVERRFADSGFTAPTHFTVERPAAGASRVQPAS